MYVLQYEDVACARTIIMIMLCVDKNWVVWETLCARVPLGLGGVWIEASFLGRSGGLHLGNMMIFMRMSEVTLWRDGMQTFYCSTGGSSRGET